jgi:hypothetical protein
MTHWEFDDLQSVCGLEGIGSERAMSESLADIHDSPCRHTLTWIACTIISRRCRSLPFCYHPRTLSTWNVGLDAGRRNDPWAVRFTFVSISTAGLI